MSVGAAMCKKNIQVSGTLGYFILRFLFNCFSHTVTRSVFSEAEREKKKRELDKKIICCRIFEQNVKNSISSNNLQKQKPQFPFETAMAFKNYNK